MNMKKYPKHSSDQYIGPNSYGNLQNNFNEFNYPFMEQNNFKMKKGNINHNSPAENGFLDYSHPVHYHDKIDSNMHINFPEYQAHSFPPHYPMHQANPNLKQTPQYMSRNNRNNNTDMYNYLNHDLIYEKEKNAGLYPIRPNNPNKLPAQDFHNQNPNYNYPSSQEYINMEIGCYDKNKNFANNKQMFQQNQSELKKESWGNNYGVLPVSRNFGSRDYNNNKNNQMPPFSLQSSNKQMEYDTFPNALNDANYLLKEKNLKAINFFDENYLINENLYGEI